MDGDRTSPREKGSMADLDARFRASRARGVSPRERIADIAGRVKETGARVREADEIPVDVFPIRRFIPEGRLDVRAHGAR